MKQFKIRCSAIGQIMTNAKGAITEKQLQNIVELQNKVKRTIKQEETLQTLIAKRDAPPELSDTTKTFVDIWLKEQIYGRRKEFSNKYTEKGIAVEDDSIEFISDYFGEFYVKNEERFENDFMSGEPDIILNHTIIDVKNSWDCFTFPLFETKINPIYYWQGQGYMALTGRKKYKLIYVLSNTPENLIEQEAWSYAKKQGLTELPVEIYEMFRKELTYDDIPTEKKVKVLNFERNESDIESINKRVLEIRNYLTQIKI